jgi:hypothetical protein
MEPAGAVFAAKGTMVMELSTGLPLIGQVLLMQVDGVVASAAME